jgi:putative zinc finger protein
MKDCEHYETLISAWHDSELDRSGQVEMLDHLMRCPGCRNFYLDARGLAGLVAAVGNPNAGEVPSPGVWRRIERSSRSRGPGRLLVAGPKRRFWAPAWGVAAAAAVLLILFNSPWGKGPIPLRSPTSRTEIRLGGNPGGMNDEQFVELTKRVLGADKKYRTAFYEIMRQVVEDTQESVPSSDLLLRQGEGRQVPEAPENVGGPS